MSTDRVAAPRTGTRALLLGGATSGVCAYGFTILGARALGEVAYAPVGVLWTVQYLVFTVGLLSVEALVTRDGRVTRGVAQWVALIVAGLLVAGALSGPTLFGSSSVVWPVVMAALGLAYAALVSARGEAAARRRFTAYGIMSGGESALRLVLAAAVVAVVPTGPAMALTMPAGAALVSGWWLLARRSRPVADGGTAAAPVVAPAAFLTSTTTANAVLQLLLAGGPLATAALGAPAAVTSQVFVTTTASRAPLVLLYSGMLARVLTAAAGRPLVSMRGTVVRGAVITVLGAAAAAAAGAVLGPQLVALAFGEGLRPSAAFAGLTGGAVVLAMALLAGNQLLIAAGAARRLVWPWVVALAAGAGVLMAVRTSPETRVGAATLVGLAVAGAGVAAQLLRDRPGRADQAV